LKDGRIQSCGCLKAELARQNKERREQARQEQEVERNRLLEQTQNQELEANKSSDWRPQDRNGRRFKFGTPERKHDAVRGMLFYSDVSKDDALWSLNFYKALIADGCHYCHGLLGEGLSLDLIIPESELGSFWAGNVVAACLPCIERRNVLRDSLTFSEMEVLGQTLELIRLRRG